MVLEVPPGHHPAVLSSVVVALVGQIDVTVPHTEGLNFNLNVSYDSEIVTNVATTNL